MSCGDPIVFCQPEMLVIFFYYGRINISFRIFLFSETQVKLTNVYIKDTTLISAYPVLLFGGDITVQHREQVITVDDWIQFKVIYIYCNLKSFLFYLK